MRMSIDGAIAATAKNIPMEKIKPSVRTDHRTDLIESLYRKGQRVGIRAVGGDVDLVLSGRHHLQILRADASLHLYIAWRKIRRNTEMDVVAARRCDMHAAAVS